jgi:hypothetical protein
VSPLTLMWKVEQHLKRNATRSWPCRVLFFPQHIAKDLNVTWLEAALALRCLLHESRNVKKRDDGRWYYQSEPPITPKSPVGCP